MPLVPVPKPTFAQKLRRFFMTDLIKGLGVTLKFNVGALTDKDAVAGRGIYTEQYPKVRPDVAPRFHGAPRLNMDPETHETLCIACNLCAIDWKSTRLNSSHTVISYAVFCLKKKKKELEDLYINLNYVVNIVDEYKCVKD